MSIDDLYRTAISELFESNDAIKIIKLKDIYETMETASDRCVDVADVDRRYCFKIYLGKNMLEIAIIGIAIALIFDFVNGFNDSANSVATVIGTRVLKPIHAVALSAIANFRTIHFWSCSCNNNSKRNR